MITFTDNRLYVKGTCNVILSDVTNGNIYYQDNKTSTGSITPSTNLNEIRAGLGNPIAAMIPSDSDITVDFDSAAFSLWAKSAQTGAAFSYGAPVPKCQIVTATGTSLSIDVSGGVPVAKLGNSSPICYVQEVGAASFMMTDGAAYPISAAGAITGFTATNGKTYKVWYDVQNVSAQKAVLSSLIDPKVVRFEAQIAVYSNLSGGSSQGTRVGWLYLTIPFLKMQGDAAISGDQSQNDTTKISGHAIAYEPSVVPNVCSDCDTSTLAYYVYAPDDDASSIKGVAVVGGEVEVKEDETAQIPVYLVSGDGSLVVPSSYKVGFTYELASGGSTYASVSDSGVVTGVAAGETEVEITYEDSLGNEYTCPVNITVKAAS